ncbi:MAG: hypothetical protein R2794_04010 [Chitinophagales bacterium]
MGLKARITFLKDYTLVEDEVLLKDLGLQYSRRRDSILEKRIYDNRNEQLFSIGEMEGVKIICHAVYPLLGFESIYMSEYEYRLNRIFRPGIMLGIGLHSAMNIYGYSFVKKGKKLRVMSGSVEGKLFEGGRRTDFEDEIYSGYDHNKQTGLFISKDGASTGNESMFGEELALSFTRLFFDKPFDQFAFDLIKLRTYQIERENQQLLRQKRKFSLFDLFR